MLDQSLYELWLQRVEDVEEVLSIRSATLSHLAREVLHEFCVVLHHRPQTYHRQFIIEWHVDPLDLIESQKSLLIFEHFFEEVFVEHVVGWKVKLH